MFLSTMVIAIAGVILTGSLVLLVPLASAATGLPDVPALEGGFGSDFVVGILCPIMPAMFWVLVSLSVIFVLIAAYKYLMSAGDPQKVSDATKTITYAAIAVAVALLAKGVPLMVGQIFGAQGVGSICY